MNTATVQSSPLSRLVHWCARVTSLLLLVLVIVMRPACETRSGRAHG
jgi:hypothetical protein